MSSLNAYGGAPQKLPSFTSTDASLSKGEGKKNKRKRKEKPAIAPGDEPVYTQKVAQMRRKTAVKKQEELNEIHVKKIKSLTKD